MTATLPPSSAKPSPTKAKPESGRLPVVLVVLGAAALMAVANALGLFAFAIDLLVYRMGGEALLHDFPLYTRQLPGTLLVFTYPPFAAVMMVPLAAVPLQVATVVWSGISLLSLLLVWRICLPQVKPHYLVALTLIAFALEPVWLTFSLGQINLLLMAMILADLCRADGSRMRGFWVGVAIGIKLTPLVFLALLVVTRQWKALRNAVLGVVATVAVGFAAAPKESWEYWTESVSNPERLGGIAYTSNQSINGFLLRFGGDYNHWRPLWFLLAATTGLLLLWLSRRLWLTGDRLGSVSVCAMAAIYASPVSWSHHWVWIIPLGVTLVRAAYARWGLAWTGVIGVLWFGLFVARPIWWVPNTNDRELDWTFWQAIPGNSYLLGGIAGLAVLTVLVVKTPPAARTG